MKQFLSLLLSFTTLFSLTTADLPDDYSSVSDNISSSEYEVIPSDGEYSVMPLAAAVSSVVLLNNYSILEDGTYKYYFDFNDYFISHPDEESNKESLLEAYNYYRSAFDDPTKSIFVVDGARSTLSSTNSPYFYFTVFIYDSSSSFRYRSDWGFTADSDYYAFRLNYASTNPNIYPLGYHKNSGEYCSQNFGRAFLVKGKLPTDYLQSYTVSGTVNFEVIFAGFEETSMHTLTVNYLYSEDNPAADPVIKEFASGEEYNIPSPEIEGYGPSIPVVSGIMPDEDLTIDVYYTKGFYPITVEYRYQDGSKAAQDVILQYPCGFVYDVPSPNIEGHTPDKSSVTGVMPNGPLSEVVTYTKNLYDLRIDYRYQDGTQAAESYYQQLTFGSSYSVPSPQLDGYKPDQSVIAGIMPSHNVNYTVVYQLDPGGGGGDQPGEGEGEGDGDGDDDGDDDDDDDDSGGTGSGGGGPVEDPFIPSQPPFSGYDPFDMSSGLPGWSGYDPFHIWGLPSYNYDPFVMGGNKK